MSQGFPFTSFNGLEFGNAYPDFGIPTDFPTELPTTSPQYPLQYKILGVDDEHSFHDVGEMLAESKYKRFGSEGVNKRENARDIATKAIEQLHQSENYSLVIVDGLYGEGIRVLIEAAKLGKFVIYYSNEGDDANNFKAQEKIIELIQRYPWVKGRIICMHKVKDLFKMFDLLETDDPIVASQLLFHQ